MLDFFASLTAISEDEALVTAASALSPDIFAATPSAGNRTPYMQ
jgi:hypothetical protein